MGALLAALGSAGVGSLIAGGLNLGSSLITNMFNKNQSDNANELSRQNLEWQKEQYFDQKAYNEQLQNKLFEREDSSYQRTKDDLVKAGYSPLAINGTNDAGTVVGQPNIPELQGINPFQANSLNFGQLADIIGQADSRAIEREKLDLEEKKQLSDTEQKELDREQRKYQSDIAWQQAQDQFTMQFQQQKSNDEKKNELIDKQVSTLNTQIDNLKQAMQINDDEFKFNTLSKIFKQKTGREHGNFKFVPDDEAEQMQAQWQEDFASYLKDHSQRVMKKPTSYSSGSNGSGSATVLGSGLNAQYGSNESTTWDTSKAFDELLDAYLQISPFPIQEKLRPSYY